MRSGESNGSVFESSGWGITQAWSDALLPQAAFLTLVLGDSRRSTSLLFKLELSCREQRKPVTGLPGKHKRGNTAKIRDRDVCGNWNPSGPSLNGWIIRILYKHWPVRPTKKMFTRVLIDRKNNFNNCPQSVFHQKCIPTEQVEIFAWNFTFLSEYMKSD